MARLRLADRPHRTLDGGRRLRGRRAHAPVPPHRQGAGAPIVAWRRRAEDAPAEQFLPERLPLAATAVLRPDLAVLLGTAPQAGGTSVAQAAKLELYDPARVSSVVVAGRPIGLAGDLSA